MCTHICAYIACIDCEKGSPNQYPDKIFHLRCFASLSSIKEANLKWKVNRYVAGWLCCDFPSVPPWAEAPGHWPCFFHLAKRVNLSRVRLPTELLTWIYPPALLDAGCGIPVSQIVLLGCGSGGFQASPVLLRQLRQDFWALPTSSSSPAWRRKRSNFAYVSKLLIIVAEVAVLQQSKARQNPAAQVLVLAGASRTKDKP